MDSDLRVEANLYLKQVQRIGNSLIPANMQWIDFSLMAMSQRMAMPRVVAEQQKNTCTRVISM